MTAANVQRELAEVTLTHRHVGSVVPGQIQCACGWVGPYLSQHQADRLTPTVQGLIDAAEKRAAAAALREAAKALHVDPLLRAADYASYVTGKLRDRAAALDAAGAVDEAAR